LEVLKVTNTTVGTCKPTRLIEKIQMS